MYKAVMLFYGLVALAWLAAPATPNTALLQFDDGSAQLCGVHSYTVDYTRLTLLVTTCAPADRIFYNGFEVTK
jgi:hypothetical protein